MSFTSPAWDGTNGHGWDGEYGTMQFLGREKGFAQFEQHRATWINETDIQAIAKAGLNTVRVPVGFWIVNDDSSTTANDITRVYAPGALKYLDRLINEWAVKYNLAVMLSLHAHQGSQNGYDHSAPQVLSTTSWSTSQANVDNSLQFATFLAARYKDSVAFLGMNLMNEPSYPTDYTVLLGYYKEAYRRIRATGNNCVLGVSPMLQEQGPPTMMDFMRWPDYVNVWHEFHVYYKWGYEGQNEQSILNAAKTYRGSHLDNWSGNWVFMGEWSLASPDSAPFSDRNLLKQFALVQMEQFKGARAGWSFWAWRHDDETKGLSPWCLRQLLREGILTVPKQVSR
ncbi:hypothetical protein Poli38472_005051 [Pythium oligandrum]|uniref:glucan 1,3-beta-glucosidase n=1 Tax=Pythium oligandrum TaxID=41045 RepID=A0A8K1CG77_PYTOL|nr:hypothetical protein Poli38472_005051 [Pythium oligandrum]|eukprot:TMW62433.1 hypothetical protein Poli38472_005051 [Pythium oligandrum]